MTITEQLDHANLSGTQLHPPYNYIQDTDPGAVGARLTWLDTSGAVYVLYMRNDSNNGWVVVGSGEDYTPGDLADWDCVADPGSKSEALDQLASRVAVLEGVGGGGRVLLETLSPNGVGTITSSASLGGYQALIIEFALRGTQVSANSNGYIEFNGDTTDSNYSWNKTSSFGINPYGTAAYFYGDDNRQIFGDNISAASAPSNSYTIGFFRIPFYTNTSMLKKGMGSFYEHRDNSSVYGVFCPFGFTWKSTSAITAIRFYLDSGNFDNSIIKIYGEA